MSLDSPNLEQTPRQNGDNQFRFLLNAFLEHWVSIGVATIVGALSWAAIMWIMSEVTPARYTKSVDIRIKGSHWDDDVLKDVAGTPLFKVTPRSLAEATDRQAIANDVATALIALDLEKGGARAASTRPEDRKLLAERVASQIAYQPLDDSNSLRIEITDCETATEAENIAEFAARVFVEHHRQRSMESGKKTHDFVLRELAALQKQLFEAETREWEFKRELGFSVTGHIDQEMAALYDELKQATATKEEVEAKLNELNESLAVNAAELPESLGNVTDGVVDNLFLELDGLLQERLTMSQIYQPDFPGMKDINAEIEEKKQTILAAFGELDEGANGANMWRNRQEIYKQRMDLRLRSTDLDVRANTIKRMLEEMMPQIPELANRNLEARQLEQETESIREEFNRLTQREWKIRTALNRGPGEVVRADSMRAAVALPLGGARGGFAVNLLIGGLVGFVVLLGFWVMSEMNNTAIRSIEDVNTHLSLEVVGTIPRMRFGRPRRFLSRRRRATYVTTVDEEQIDACIVTQHDPKSPISEAYRTLRTNFQFATLKRPIRTVMMTSAVPGEGKTTTAVNLAVTMADRGMRVLIVDTDLRRPNVHRVLRMERGPGLADVLREGLDPQSVIRPTRIENLWIISSGRVPPNPSELIGSDRMSELMQQLGGAFDIVICDAPSVLVVTDPVLLATHVDTCIMVVSTENARRETILRAKKLLESANCEITGVVVNGLETTRRHYYYYYYYYDEGASVRRRWSHFF
jgi:capsular exopolysaccharide synthesis family protein